MDHGKAKKAKEFRMPSQSNSLNRWQQPLVQLGQSMFIILQECFVGVLKLQQTSDLKHVQDISTSQIRLFIIPKQFSDATDGTGNLYLHEPQVHQPPHGVSTGSWADRENKSTMTWAERLSEKLSHLQNP